MARQPLTKQELDELAERGSQLAERLMDHQLILDNTQLEQIKHMRTLQTTKNPKICNATLELLFPFEVSIRSMTSWYSLFVAAHVSCDSSLLRSGGILTKSASGIVFTPSSTNPLLSPLPKSTCSLRSLVTTAKYA